MQPWIRKYEPETIKDIVGQDRAIAVLKEYISNYAKQKKKAILVYGESGIGKTCTIHALANESGYEIIEVNASDFRNKENIDRVVGNALKQRSLFSFSKIILIDEVDGLSGNKDRGGISEIAALIEESKFPIILTANNPWDNKFSGLRSKCELLEFPPLDFQSVFKVLEKICKQENIKYTEDLLKTFARRAGPDLRAAINDLQSITMSGKLEKKDIDEISERGKTEAITSALLKIFKTTDAEIAKNALENVDEDIDQCILWIDENLPKEYTLPEDLARAYDKLSRADVFNGRIRRRQHWRFIVYINMLLSAGIATAKDEKYKQFVKYAPTQRLLSLWRANMKYQKRKSIAGKIAEKTHASVKDTIKDSLPFVQLMIINDKKLGSLIAEDLDLDSEEIAWMQKSV